MSSEESKATTRLVICASLCVTLFTYWLIGWKYCVALLVTSTVMCVLFLVLYLVLKRFSYNVLHYTLISLSIQLLTVLVSIMIDAYKTY